MHLKALCVVAEGKAGAVESDKIRVHSDGVPVGKYFKLFGLSFSHL